MHDLLPTFFSTNLCKAYKFFLKKLRVNLISHSSKRVIKLKVHKNGETCEKFRVFFFFYNCEVRTYWRLRNNAKLSKIISVCGINKLLQLERELD